MKRPLFFSILFCLGMLSCDKEESDSNTSSASNKKVTNDEEVSLKITETKLFLMPPPTGQNPANWPTEGSGRTDHRTSALAQALQAQVKKFFVVATQVARSGTDYKAGVTLQVSPSKSLVSFSKFNQELTDEQIASFEDIENVQTRYRYKVPSSSDFTAWENYDQRQIFISCKNIKKKGACFFLYLINSHSFLQAGAEIEIETTQSTLPEDERTTYQMKIELTSSPATM